MADPNTLLKNALLESEEASHHPSESRHQVEILIEEYEKIAKSEGSDIKIDTVRGACILMLPGAEERAWLRAPACLTPAG